MERQLQFYMDKAFIFEENGYFSESLELCNKCLEAYPEYENEIVFEIAKMNYRNGRLEDALLYFVKFYQLTNDDTVIDLILDIYYKENRQKYLISYEENCAILKDYPYFYGNNVFSSANEIRFFPIFVVEEFLYYFDKREREIGCIKRVKLKIEENCICLADSLLWQDDILKLEESTRMRNPLLDNENALLLTYDEVTWILFLQIINLKNLIQFDRIVLFDSYKSLEETISSARVAFPEFVISDKVERIRGILDSAYNKYRLRLNECQIEMEKYYKENEQTILKRIQDGKPRILFVTSRFTTALQYHVRDFKNAADCLGLNTELCIEENRLCPGVCILLELETIIKFKPDIFFIIDHFRFEHAISGIKQIVCITWIQDSLDIIMDNRTPEKLNNRDIILSHYISWGEFEDIGYDKRCIINAPIPANSRIYKKYQLTVQEKHNYSCDICFVCHAADVENFICESVKIVPEEYQTAFFSVFKGYQQYVYETGTFFYTEEEFRLYVRGALSQHYNIMIRDKFLELVARDMHLVFNELLYRQVLVDWLLDAGYENIKLWGNGWMNDPKYAKYAMGPAENGETLSKIYQASKIVIGNNIHSTAAARAWESMLSGAFYISNYIPPEVDFVDIRKIMKVDEELIMFYGKEDFLSKVEYYLTHEEKRLQMAEIGYKAASERMTYDILVKKVMEELPKRLALLQEEDADER